MPRLQVVITEDQETILNAQAAAVGGALKQPVSVPDLIRLWVDQGCHVQTPGPAAGTVVGEIAGQPVKASGGPITHNITNDYTKSMQSPKPATATPAPAEKDRTPLTKSSGKIL